MAHAVPPVPGRNAPAVAAVILPGTAPQLPAATSTPPGPPPVVLVVDADPDARVGYARSFEVHGCTAVLAESVAEAITCLSRPWMAIDVVWMGLDLPDGRVETILAILKNTARLGNVRTVAHAAAGDDPDGGDRIVDLAGYGVGAYVDEPENWATVICACFPGA